MVPQTQITEVYPDELYEVAHQFGPSYSGPTGGLDFVDGRPHPCVPVLGQFLRMNGLACLVHFWLVRPGHKLQWNGEAWEYIAPDEGGTTQPPLEPPRSGTSKALVKKPMRRRKVK